jgi:hypothetical protein
MLNVGDLKPLEIPINHFMDLAYNTPQWGYDSVPTWLKLWASREFGPEYASNISSIVDTYGMLAAHHSKRIPCTSHSAYPVSLKSAFLHWEVQVADPSVPILLVALAPDHDAVSSLDLMPKHRLDS